MRFIITPFPAPPASRTHPAWIFSWECATTGLRSGGGSEELRLGMMSLQVPCSRGRRGEQPGGHGVSGSHSLPLPAPSRR